MTQKKKLGFSKSIKSKICQEIPSEDNPYLANERLIAGYNIEDLASQTSLVDSIYLLFKGELPDKVDSQLLNTLFISLINLGPRHPAIRASMTAGISKTRAEHLLPIGLLTLGGEKGGASEVELAYQFIQKSLHQSPEVVAASLMAKHTDLHSHIAPGFGSAYGDIDPILTRIAAMLAGIKPESAVFDWCSMFVDEIAKGNTGWLVSGLAAAVFLELGMGKRESVGLFQLACAPGLVAHAMEQTHRPITDMPLLEDENYVLKK
jgi:citrate synthase